jgi:hypothetical protein
LGSKSRWAHLYPERKERQTQCWEKIESLFCRYEREWSPAAWKCFVYREGSYLLVRFITLCLFLYVITNKLRLLNFIILILTIYLLLDILISNTSIAFVTMKPINTLRSFFLTLFAFSHVIVAYGILYKFFGDQFNSPMCNTQVIYFSTVTITTLGYGDYAPTGLVAQWLVVLQVLTGVFFLAGVIARIISLKNAPEANDRHG